MKETVEAREKLMQKLMKEVKKRLRELKNLGYTLSDRDSTICLFDDRMFKGKHFNDLSDEEQQRTIVDSL